MLKDTAKRRAVSHALFLVRFQQTDLDIDFCVNQLRRICRYTVKLSFFFTLRENMRFLVTKNGVQDLRLFCQQQSFRAISFLLLLFVHLEHSTLYILLSSCVIVFHPLGILSLCGMLNALLP